MTKPNSLDEALTAWSREAIPPADLSARIAQAVVRDFRFRRRVRIGTRIGGGAMAILTLITVVWFRGISNDQLAASTKTVVNPFRETSNLLANASKTLTDGLPDLPNAPDSFSLDQFVNYPTPELDRFKGLPEAAKLSMEPLAEPTTRAVNRFVKDLGSAIGLPKPKM